MARLGLLLTLAALATFLVRALVREHRRQHRDALIERLRAAFIHGTPFVAPRPSVDGRTAALPDLELNFPATWVLEPTEEGLRAKLGPAGDRSLVIDWPVRAISADETWSRPEDVMADAQLSKRVELTAQGTRVIYAWRLSVATAQAPTLLARFDVPLSRIEDVLVAADVAAIERALRQARLPSARDARAAAAPRT